MNAIDLHAYLVKHHKQMIEQLEWLVELESPSTEPACLQAINHSLEKHLLGFLDAQTEIIGSPEYPVLHGVIGSGDKKCLILCHADTVFPSGTLEKFPFERQGETAKGPGVIDMKGGIIQGLWALKSVQEFGWPDNLEVHLLISSDEETGSRHSRAIVEKWAKECSSVLVLEPAQGEALKNGRKGVGGFRVTITGAAAHAGINFEKGQNAAVEAAHQILAISRLTDLEKGTTVNVGVVNGGTRPNVVAETVTIAVDMRVWSEAEARRVIDALYSLEPVNPQCQIEVSGQLNRPPMSPDHPGARELLQKAQAAAAELGFAIEAVSTGGASDGNFTAGLGIATLDGLGAVGHGAHTSSETINLNKMPERAALLAGILLKLAE